MTASDLVLDTWANLDYKSAGIAPYDQNITTWSGDQRRRQQAYILLAAYKQNVARYFIKPERDEDDDEALERRELGDAQVIVDTIVSALLGNDVTIVCSDSPELEKWAQRWGKKVHAVRKLFTMEDHAVGLGDGIIALSWDGLKKRVDLKVYDPGFYYPVLDGASDDEFPDRVHIAWEFIRIDAEGKEKTYIRRRTWDLREPFVDGEAETDEPPTAGRSCFYSDGEWLLDDLELNDDYDSLRDATAHWYTNADGEELHDIDLGIDFIPVVHQPNTAADDDEHFGTSSISMVLQIIDEIQATDSDLAKGASIAGFPPLASDGALASMEDKDGRVVDTYGPGTVFGGHLSTIDTSKALDALLKYLDQLLQRLAVNSHLPEAVIGRVKPSEVPSGLAFALGFAPLTAMIYRMRLIREEKRPLIFKFAYRIAEAAGQEGLPALPEGEDWEWPTFQPGAFLPSDVEHTVNVIQKLFNVTPHVLSIETAVELLIEAGLPIDDAKAEVERIRHEDFAGANELTLAVDGDARPAFEYLGLPVPDDYVSPGQAAADAQAAAQQQHAQQMEQLETRSAQQPPGPEKQPTPPPPTT